MTLDTLGNMLVLLTFMQFIILGAISLTCWQMRKDLRQSSQAKKQPIDSSSQRQPLGRLSD